MVYNEPYQDRPAWLIEVADISGWQIKFYGMCAAGISVNPELIEAAKSFLEANAQFDSESGYGFSILHRGEEAVWLLLDWWKQDILHQRLFCSELEKVSFQQGPPNHEMACVWELQVITHERDAWVEHVMTDPSNANFDAYLKDQILIKAQ